MSLRIRPHRSTARPALLLGAAGAAVFGLAWLPTGLASLTPVGFFLMLRGLALLDSPRDALRFGLVVGLVRYGVMAHFLLVLGTFSPWAVLFYPATILYILPQAALESWGAVWLERRFCVSRTLAFPSIWIVLEKLRTLTDLSLPADLTAHGLGAAPAWLLPSRWLGPFGVTATAFAVAWIADRAWRLRHRRALAVGGLAIASLVWALPPMLGAPVRPIPSEASAGIRIGIVQPFASAEDKLRRERWPAGWERIEAASARVARGVDLVIWPETARPGPLLWKDGDRPRDPEVARIAETIGVPILYGADIARFENGHPVAIYNSAVLVRPGDDRVEWYGKQRLLPFVEGVPFADHVGVDPSRRRATGTRKSAIAFLGNFRPGPELTIFEVGSARIGALICYEGMYPQFARAYRNRGANLLVLLTNDAWWGRSTFGPWHAAMLASRAVEVDLPIVRAANSGISELVLPSGEVPSRTELLGNDDLTVEAFPARGEGTPYSRWGDGPVFAVLFALCVASRRRVRAESSTARPS